MFFDELSEENFLLFAIKNYNNPQGLTEEDFYKDLNHITDLAINKKYEQFFSLMSESCIDDIVNIKTLLSSELIRDTYAYCELNLQVDGSIKKAVNQ